MVRGSIRVSAGSSPQRPDHWKLEGSAARLRMLRTINEPEWGEAVGLRWADIDLEGGALSVSRAIASVDGVAIETEPKTSKGRRAIALDPATVDALRRNRERQAAERELVGDGWTESGAFFTYPDGRTLHPDHVMVTFRRLVTGAGLPLIRLHDRRHTLARAVPGVDR